VVKYLRALTLKEIAAVLDRMSQLTVAAPQMEDCVMLEDNTHNL